MLASTVLRRINHQILARPNRHVAKRIPIRQHRYIADAIALQRHIKSRIVIQLNPVRTAKRLVHIRQIVAGHHLGNIYLDRLARAGYNQRQIKHKRHSQQGNQNDRSNDHVPLSVAALLLLHTFYIDEFEFCFCQSAYLYICINFTAFYLLLYLRILPYFCNNINRTRRKPKEINSSVQLTLEIPSHLHYNSIRTAKIIQSATKTCVARAHHNRSRLSARKSDAHFK